MTTLDIITVTGGLTGFAGCITTNQWSALVSAVGAAGCAVIALIKLIKEIIKQKKDGD